MDLINAQVIGYPGLQHLHISPQGDITTLQSIETAPPLPEAIDLQGDWLSPGGIDLQINGALGLAFPNLNLTHLDQLHAIGDFLWDQGIDGYLPTLVTSSIANIQQALHTLQTFLEQPPRDPCRPSAQILGVHLEGPFLNPGKRGAHPEEFLLPLTFDQVKTVLGDYAPLIKIITLAPELDPTGKIIPYLRSLGITVSLGHSLATAAQAHCAFDQGATMVTHAFNAMPPLHHREPGLLGAALTTHGVSCGVIADGQHLCPTILELLLRAGEYDRRLFLVSDALAALGLPDGVYPWDDRFVTITAGTAYLPCGTLAGTTLSLLQGAQNLAAWHLCPPATAIALATLSPRRAIGLPGLLPGQPATLLRWHFDESSQTLNWTRVGYGR